MPSELRFSPFVLSHLKFILNNAPDCRLYIWRPAKRRDGKRNQLRLRAMDSKQSIQVARSLTTLSSTAFSLMLAASMLIANGTAMADPVTARRETQCETQVDFDSLNLTSTHRLFALPRSRSETEWTERIFNSIPSEFESETRLEHLLQASSDSQHGIIRSGYFSYDARSGSLTAGPDIEIERADIVALHDYSPSGVDPTNPDSTVASGLLHGLRIDEIQTDRLLSEPIHFDTLRIGSGYSEGSTIHRR